MVTHISTRYFKIICKSYSDAVKLKIATINWLKERLNLEVSEEKTKIVNLKRNYSEFLGFKIKVRKKSKNARYTIISHMSDKAKEKVKSNVKNRLKDIRKANTPKQIEESIDKHNLTLIGAHNYYNKATCISIDMNDIESKVYYIMKKTLKETIVFQIPNYLNNGFIEKTYGKSKCLVKLYGANIVPIHFVKYKTPMQQKNSVCKYTKTGRNEIHTGLECMDYETIKDIVNNSFVLETVELNDIIIPKCASQYGKCYVSKKEIKRENLDFIYKNNNLINKDSYQNIIIVDKNIKGLLLRGESGIMTIKKKYYKERRTIG